MGLRLLEMGILLPWVTHGDGECWCLVPWFSPVTTVVVPSDSFASSISFLC